MDNGSEIYSGTTSNMNMINCIVKKMRDKNIPISARIYEK